ncbi:MAG: replication initiator protein [Wigfec virus K19_177]|nr:MAG: replication initiator protein [Wigfec virus K19_177]
MCLFPTRASLPLEGGRPLLNKEGDLILPCGKCRECISKRAMEWSQRARHEMAQHEENCFLTLTYSEENLKSDFIVKPDFQKFIKLLRYHTGRNIRYMVSYEYGTKTYRPHMHAIIFGWEPCKQKFLKHTNSGHPLFTSDEVGKLWKHGFHSIGAANEKTAYYIASYALSGRTRTITHPRTGEVTTISDAMDVSKRPAIGLSYLLHNARQLVDSGGSMPRYYVKKLKEFNPTLHQRFEDERITTFSSRSSYGLYAKFKIGEAQASHLDNEYRENSNEQQQIKAHENYLASKSADYDQLQGKK